MEVTKNHKLKCYINKGNLAHFFLKYKFISYRFNSFLQKSLCHILWKVLQINYSK